MISCTNQHKPSKTACRLQRGLSFLMALWLASAAWAQNASQGFNPAVETFVTQHCYKCHSGDKVKGDFHLDTLSRDLSDAATAISWQEALDVVRLGEMPPSSQPQPAAKVTKAFVDDVQSEMRRHAEEASKGIERLQVRRLSLSAMDYAARDLFDTHLKLSDGLPKDPVVAGFDNMSATVGQSSEFMRALQDSAARITGTSIVGGRDPRVTLAQPAAKMGKGRDTVAERRDILMWTNRNRQGVVWPNGFVAPRSGVYRVMIQASQSTNLHGVDRNRVNLNGGWKSAVQSLPPSRLRRVSIMASEMPVSKGGDGGSTGGRRVGDFYISDKMENHVTEIELEAGESFFILAVDCGRLQWKPTIKIKGKEEIAGEVMRMRGLKVHGPLADDWPPKVSRQLVLGNGQVNSNGFRQFLRSAFREPVQEEVLRLYLTLFNEARKQGMTGHQSMQRVIEAVLSSPRFLYVRSPKSEQDALALASRLSFFLWSSIPDNELLKLAESGKLLEEATLKAQVRRMIADEKSERFVKDFTGQWLQMRKVGEMQPDPKLYPDYDPTLEIAMRAETEALFREILSTNAPVTEFLDPGYAMINERLAVHYGIKDVKGDDIRRVKLPANNPRGGLLGHASVHTLTSNGTSTSPVVRGVWVLENLLDSPPSPPPPDVEPIEPDIRGAKSVRDMLAKHREIPTCYECHRRIDHWGFGLENFNAVGAWRNKYGDKQQGKSVDASGETPQGDRFNGVVEMRKTLLKHSERFTHALTAKMLKHAIGHPATVQERLKIDEIVNQNMANGNRFADLIEAVCLSDAFTGGNAKSAKMAQATP